MRRSASRRHRKALTAVEQKLRALGPGNAAKARKAATQVADLDQIGIYSGCDAAVAPLADRLDRAEAIDDARSDWTCSGFEQILECLNVSLVLLSAHSGE